MRLTVVGCAGSFPGPETSSSSYLLEAEGFTVVVDLGNGSLGQLQRYCAPGDVGAVLLSHLHPDHCMDVLPLYVARTYDPYATHEVLPVHAPAGAATQLARAYGRVEPPGLEGTFAYTDWTAGTHRIGPFEVTVARVAHPVETWGMRIAYGGRSIAYSADTGPCDALVELARGADLALFESSFEEGRDDAAPPDLHLTGGQAGQQAAAAGVGRLVLTHLPPWNDPQVSLAAARREFGGDVELARPGATYDL